MRTRTLLLLSVLCGTAILLAGALQLARIARNDPSTVLSIGDTGGAGDAEVEVVSYREADGRAEVEVRISGVDDPAGLDDFRLRAPNALVAPSSDSTCPGLTLAATRCVVTFDARTLEATDRQLVLQRGEDRVVWRLAG